MPYTDGQCKMFASKAARGEKVPSDWQKHCQGVHKGSKAKKGKKKGGCK